MHIVSATQDHKLKYPHSCARLTPSVPNLRHLWEDIWHKDCGHTNIIFAHHPLCQVWHFDFVLFSQIKFNSKALCFDAVKKIQQTS